MKFDNLYFLEKDDGQEMFLRAKDNKTFFSIKADDIIKSFLQQSLEAQKKRLKNDIDNKITQLLREFSNTPIDERSNGWNWLLKLRDLNQQED